MVNLLTLPFEGERFKDCWAKLCLTKKWKGKTLEALSLSLKKLAKYQEEFACELVENAIEKGWQGVVYDDTDDKYEKWIKAHGKSSIQTPKVPGSKIFTAEELQGEAN